ncbi:catechol 1,2-dioxygenase [Kribbella sp. ALI-6-A]|uniref:dioxygenase family protein n=1 Tax=Kribbella sp. ALI-6-A TaxID=1933817 RepID=UPI00097C3CBF|nr:dioxygenase [Kribbella sp. ALI-6-A]ONI74066.1 catechol 1,2-dioxygenase [Kribbella sp. ALI-6-A]
MSATQTSPSAADAGANASDAFRASVARRPTAETSQERTDRLVRRTLDAIYEVIRTEEVSYPEFQAVKRWLMDVGEVGEWPLFLDVFVEHEIEKVAARTQRGTTGTIEGPYYLPGQQRLPATATLPMRPDEQGDRLVFSGQVRALDGTVLAGAEVDFWQADADGYYSGFAPNVPAGNLRGVIVTDTDGRFAITTIKPAPYQIPTDGPTGAMIAAAGWHPWRPAHLHLMVRAEGHRQVTTQLYFDRGDWLDSDVASATKDDLVLAPQRQDDGGYAVTYDFELEPAATS